MTDRLTLTRAFEGAGLKRRRRADRDGDLRRDPQPCRHQGRSEALRLASSARLDLVETTSQ